MSDFYSILGVPRNASRDEIRSAYREKAKEFQRDGMFGIQGNATQEWLNVSEAYSTLSKEDSRSAYDSELNRPTPAETTQPQSSTEGAARRYTTNVIFHPDEEEVASVMKGVFRRYVNVDLNNPEDENFGLGGQYWRVSYHFGNGQGSPNFSRKYEVRTGRDTWQDIDASNETRFKTAQKWRDLVENGVFKAVAMENGRYPGDWYDTEMAADKIADFQNSAEWGEFREWFQELWPQTAEVDKVPFRTFWINSEDDFDKSRREFQENEMSMPSTPENPHKQQVRSTAEGRIKFGDVEDMPRIIWGEPTNERIVWGNDRNDPRIKFGDETQASRPHIVFGEERAQPKQRIVFGDEISRRS